MIGIAFCFLTLIAIGQQVTVEHIEKHQLSLINILMSIYVNTQTLNRDN